MDQISGARQIFSQKSFEYDLFLQTLKQFQSAYSNISSSQLAKIEIPENLQSGSFSGLSNVMDAFCSSVTQFIAALTSFSTNFLLDDISKIENLATSRLRYKEQLDADISSASTVLNKLRSSTFEAYNHLLDLTEKLNNASKEYNELVNSANNSNSSSNKNSSEKQQKAINLQQKVAKEEIERLWPDYYNKLCIYKSERAKVIHVDKCLKEATESYFFNISQRDVLDQAQFISEMTPLSNHIKNLGDELKKTVAIFSSLSDSSISPLNQNQQNQKNQQDQQIPNQNQSNQKNENCKVILDSKKEFTKFASSHQIEFVDIRPPPFERHTFNDPKLSNELSNSRPHNLSVIPLYIARAKFAFSSLSSNELAVKKGQKVGVLRGPEEGWTLCFVLFDEKCEGYLPESYLEKVGNGIAIVKKWLNFKFFDSNVGSMLSVIRDDGEERAICEDYAGKQASVPKENLIIL